MAVAAVEGDERASALATVDDDWSGDGFGGIGSRIAAREERGASQSDGRRARGARVVADAAIEYRRGSGRDLQRAGRDAACAAQVGPVAVQDAEVAVEERVAQIDVEVGVVDRPLGAAEVDVEVLAVGVAAEGKRALASVGALVDLDVAEQPHGHVAALSAEDGRDFARMGEREAVREVEGGVEKEVLRRLGGERGVVGVVDDAVGPVDRVGVVEVAPASWKPAGEKTCGRQYRAERKNDVELPHCFHSFRCV